MPDHLEAIDDLYAISVILGSMWSLDHELGNVAGLSDELEDFGDEDRGNIENDDFEE